MKFSTSEEVIKDTVALDVKARFADEIRRMEAIGFNDEFYFRETAFPFSAVIGFPLLIGLYLMGERIRVGGWLQVITFSPYLIHEQRYAYGTVMKVGVLYVSLFDDGTLLTTATYDEGTRSQPAHRFIRQHFLTGGLEEAWKQHALTVNRLSEERAVIAPIGMKDVMRMALLNDTIITGFGLEDLKQKRKNNG